MKRDFATVIFEENFQAGYRPGDEHAHRAAAALADRFDAPTIRAVADALSFLDRIGGQMYVVTLRRQVAEDEYETEALHLRYETRDAKMHIAPPPEHVGSVPIEDFSEPPTRIEIDAPVGEEEVETDLRDEIEAEAEALDEEPAGLATG